MNKPFGGNRSSKREVREETKADMIIIGGLIMVAIVAVVFFLFRHR